uniref:Glucosamine/galactosamine-6-phosphate isomerase domain-containing protein n=1 Tax=Brassica campestris TaxID=3711 RepID=M4FHZ2_BRACM
MNQIQSLDKAIVEGRRREKKIRELDGRRRPPATARTLTRRPNNIALTWTHKDRGEIRVHENLEELSTGLVDYIAEISEASILKHGAFCIVLSGDSLISLVGKLIESLYNKIVDWDKWYVFWAEERAVNVFPRHIYSINDRLSVDKAATEDGLGWEVASLFPNHPELEVKEDWVTYLTNSPKPPPERLTFTLPVINSAANVAIVATGASKSQCYPLCKSLPARLVQPSNENLVWFLDKPAGYKLDGFKSL